MSGLYFASGWFLAALAAAVLPLAMLFTKEAVRSKIRFSSLYFLQAMTRPAARLLEWKRWLLLAARVLFLILAALAFARPFKRLDAGGGSLSPRSPLVFILDTSASMGYDAGDGRTLLDLAKEKIRLKLHAGQGPLTLYTAADKVQPVVIREKSAAVFLKKLAGVTVSDAAGSALGIQPWLAEHAQEFNGSKVTWLSDFSTAPQDAHRIAAVREVPAEIIAVRPAQFSNFYLKKIILPPRPLILGREEEIQAVYASRGEIRAPVAVAFFDGESKIGETVLDVRAQPSGTVKIRHRFEVPGLRKLSVQAEQDSLPADNRLEELSWVGDPLRLLFIQDREFRYPFESPYFYLSQVLESSEASTGSQAWFRIIRKSSAQLEEDDLAGYDMVFMADTAPPPPKTLTRLRTSLKSGGSLVVIPGRHTDPGAYAASLPMQQLLGGRFQEGEPQEEIHTLRPSSYEHPLFQIFKPRGRGRLEHVQVRRVLPFLSETPAQNKVLLWLGERTPCLIERKIGEGQVFIWTTALQTDWNDFPRDAAFVPFVFEFVKYASRGRVLQTLRGVPGEAIAVNAAADEKILEMNGPGGARWTLTPNLERQFQFEESGRAGIYSWRQAGRTFQKILSMDAAESVLVYPDLNTKAAGRAALIPSVNPPVPQRHFFYTLCWLAALAMASLETLAAAFQFREGMRL